MHLEWRLLVAVWPRAGALAGEAIAAVHGPAFSRLEWHLSGLAAAAADHVDHLAPARVSAAAAGSLACGAAFRTARRLILETAVGEELLLTGSKREGLAAIAAGKGFVGVAHFKLALLLGNWWYLGP